MNSDPVDPSAVDLPVVSNSPPVKHGALLDAPEHVLATLERDGSRRWLYPRLAAGRFWHARRIVAYVLIVIFVLIPHLRWNGKPLVLLDIPARQFHLFGHTFLPTDTLLVALLILSVFLTIVLATALAGRVWCGWACPQTVYMEFLFRPIDRFFDGTTGRGGKPNLSTARQPRWLWQGLRFVVYFLLAMFLAHTFLSYFVGTERLAQWIRSSPAQHPTAFLVMAATTGLMLFDFMFFREQLCAIACPYGRFQSVMLDRNSLIVSYDPTRGEPRGKGKRQANDSRGDCIDCGQCVAVCPTGIDIRNGLQMECIHCTQCIDACDAVMDKVNLPRGLVRFSSQAAIEGASNKLVRARTIIYPILLSIVLIGFVTALLGKYSFDVTVLRGLGDPFTMAPNDGRVQNNFRIRLTNRSDNPQQYELKLVGPAQAELMVIDPSATQLEAGESKIVPVMIRIPPAVLHSGQRRALVGIKDSDGNEREITCNLVGPPPR